MSEQVTPKSEAIHRLFREHAGTIYAIALKLCADNAAAEDLVQEVFLNAYRNWESFEGRSSPTTWLYTIAVRACRRMHRKRAGAPDRLESLHELLPFGEAYIGVIADEQDDALQQSIMREATARLETEIAALPDDFRMPLILKEIAGLSVPEIASILGMEEGTVRSRVHRARLKLRKAIDSALPRMPNPAPPPAYPEQTCLDLLSAKQAALDRGVAFDSDVICERCRSVFASLDLTQQVCRQIAAGDLPPGLRERIETALAHPDKR